MRNFAYGSNLCRSRMRERVPGATFGSVTRLPMHTLRFHKRSKDESGKADAYFTGDSADEVWGVIVEVPDDERNALDRAEGLGQGYTERDVTVYDLSGEAHQVTAYIADESAIDPSLRPYDWYKMLVVEGARAHGLPEQYIEDLAKTEDLPDPLESRPARPMGTEPC
ncbi:MAG: gamma-glutamylcyclotransferase family protein [Actinomycetota bacterium]